VRGLAGGGDLPPAILPPVGQAHAAEAVQAGAILQPIRAAVRLHQRQPVQRRTAAGLQVRLVPHVQLPRSERYSMSPADLPPSFVVMVIQTKLLCVLFWMLHGIRRELDHRIERGDMRSTDGLSRTRDELAAFKLEVARTYVPLSLMRGVDQRITDHLLRIEAKLEEVTRK